MRRQWLLILLICSQPVLSATVVTFTSNMTQGPSRMMLEGPNARLDLLQDESYMLVDARLSTLYMIVPSKKRIIEIDSALSKNTTTKKYTLHVELRPDKRGPKIAGFETQAYSYSANGYHCGTLYTSAQALQVDGIPQLLKAMDRLSSSQQSALGAYAKFMDVCKRANMTITAYTNDLGVPMQIIDRQGAVISKVKSIAVNAEVPANTFSLPEAYEKAPLYSSASGARGF